MPPVDFNIDPVLDAIDARLEMGASQPLVSMLPASTGGTGREMMNMLAAMIARSHEPSVPRSAPPPNTESDASTAAAVTAGLGAVASSLAAMGSASGSRGSSAPNPPSSGSPSSSSSSSPVPSSSEAASASSADETGAAVDRALASYDAAHPESVPTETEMSGTGG